MSFWTGKQVAVTGGSGLIGTPMVETLEAEGATVKNISLPWADITALNEMMKDLEGARVCIHLAAMSHVEESRRAGLECLETNIGGTWNVLEACKYHHIPVVTASSNHVYGKQDSFPVKEDAPLNQLDTYSVSKVCADYIARAYAHNYGLPTAVIRNTNCFGPRDPHTDHLVPGTILSLLRGEKPVLRSQGLIKKGYLYVDDVVDAFLLIAQQLVEGEIPIGEAYNVGAEAVTSRQVVDAIQSIMGVNMGVDIEGVSNDQHHEQMDSTKIYRLGWRPKHTLESGLRKTVGWFRDSMVIA